jgi:hypothetical protein
VTYDLGTLSGARLWPYQPDFRAGYELRRAFLTDVIQSRSNTEQRRALRDVPRLSASYQSIIADDELQAAKHYLRAWQNQPTAMPDFSRWAATTGSSAETDTTLTIASPPAWVSAERMLVLCAAGELELVEVVSVVGSTVTLADPLANDWPAGSIVRPALHGLLDARMRATRLTRAAQRLDVRLVVYPGGEPIESEGAASVTFNGYEVFSVEADFAGQPGIDYLYPVEQVDYSIGRTAQFRPIDRAEQMIEAQFMGLSPADAQEIEQVFLRAKGMRGAFYRPSCEKDMTLAANVSASTQMNVVGTDLADDFGAIDYAENDVALEIVQANGTRLHRLIAAIAVNGSNSRITLSSAVTITTANVARISWMPLVRFASDELATSWRSPLTASIRASFQTVKR